MSKLFINAPLPGLSEAPEELRGQLERIIFHNEENGYTVFRFKAEGKLDLLSVVGHMTEPQPGCSLRIWGSWENNPRWGMQFKMDGFEQEMPNTLDGIFQYLSSGLIKGIGPSLARRIVDKFGAATFEIMDNEIERLREVQGIGSKNFKKISETWKTQRGIKELMLFLQPHDISTAYAVRIYKFYGQAALEVVKENPYRLSMDIPGIGFITADMIAQKLGFELENDLRAEAGVLYSLNNLGKDGHVCYPREELCELCEKKLGIPAELADRAIDRLEEEERLVCEQMHPSPLVPAEKPEECLPEATESYVYLRRQYYYESSIAHYLGRLMLSPKSVRLGDSEEALAEVKKSIDIELAPEQEEAVLMAARSKVLVITGGPGTGKTTIINAIIKLFQARSARVMAAAPTGRAAKRLSETSNLEAKTIHRLLEFSPQEEGFARNEDMPLTCSLLVIDEASMLDIQLTCHLLKAVPLGATFILVGDVNQLPSVGPGNVLKDIINSGVVPVVELTQVFRQAEQSEIIMNAHLINHGQMPELRPPETGLSDFYFITQEEPEAAVDMIVSLVREHIPRRFRLDPVEDIQVLSPMNKGHAGAVNLNTRLQELLNNGGGRIPHLQRGERMFRLNDKVMQIRNNYEKDVFNGDIGRICVLDTEERELTVRYDDRNVIYDFDELDELVPAYAISIHKSQGSEYPAVVIPVLTQHYVMLQRNLIYTAVTRGRRLVVLVGSRQALAMAIRNNQTQKRHTWLAQRLAGLLPALNPEQA
ncbi:MAG: ATP-dependent RecD-like DNA helicase [Desulfovibrionaceae bacterium]|nr:ATP-dependent RecD-like DNA helicase [Desulfovibrionaceae bacterium]